MMSYVKVEALSAGYGETQVLKNIDFTLIPGSFTAIIGSNGCGKTTLLKNISGYLKPFSGNVHILNQDISKLSIKSRARYIGYVAQDISYDFKFNCQDIVMMGRLPHLGRFEKNTPKDEQIVQTSMELTDTWQFRDRTINELSGGERQRVFIARALAQKPKILLLDEPISHLDIKYQVEILALLKNLCAQGILVITVLHDINLASQFSDEIIMMKDGQVLAKGSPHSVITHTNISQAFSTDVEVFTNPRTHTPYIIPVLKSTPNLKVV